AGLGVVGGDVAACLEFGTTLADEDEALHDAGRAGDRIRLVALDGVHVPHGLAGGRIHSDEAPIQRADIDLAVVGSDAAIHHVAAGIHGPFARHLRVELPPLLAG